MCLLFFVDNRTTFNDVRLLTLDRELAREKLCLLNEGRLDRILLDDML